MCPNSHNLAKCPFFFPHHKKRGWGVLSFYTASKKKVTALNKM
jgi:hypothetical protein